MLNPVFHVAFGLVHRVCNVAQADKAPLAAICHMAVMLRLSLNHIPVLGQGIEPGRRRGANRDHSCTVPAR
jgi:hypothetical protein